MTAKERLRKLVDELTEAEAQNARIVVEEAHDAVAEQADLEAMLDEEAGGLLEEMDAEERRAGVQPWQR